MKKILALHLLFLCLINQAQTTKIIIDANCVIYSRLSDKAFAAVSPYDTNYPNSLLQLDPYNGHVEKHLSLSGEPMSMKLTPDNKHLYLSYLFLSQIIKIDLDAFQIVDSINTGNFEVEDFAILPTNENILIVSRGEGGNPENLVIYKDGVLQPKQISTGIEDPSAICIKNDGSKLYAHDGISSMCYGHIMTIADDGIEFNGTIWDYMLPSGEIKIHNDLIYGEFGDVLDAFSDSVPIIKAKMPVYKIIDESITGFEYSEIHGCYVFGHVYEYKAYISFFHGQYFNYLGSLDLGCECDVIRDLAVVDADHFILIATDTYPARNSILFYSNPSKNLIFLKAKADKAGPATKTWFGR